MMDSFKAQWGLPFKVTEFKEGNLPQGILLNINLPNLPPEEIKGIEITTLGKRSYSDIVEEGYNGKRRYYWIVRGKAEWHPEPGTDIYALNEGKISITPLGFFSNTLIPTLHRLCPKLFHSLTLKS